LSIDRPSTSRALIHRLETYPGTELPVETSPSESPGCGRARSTAIVLFVAVVASEPGRKPIDCYLEVGVLVDERLQLFGEPSEADLFLAASLAELLDTPVGEVHGIDFGSRVLRVGARLSEVARFRPA
jgi:hypothetical protein